MPGRRDRRRDSPAAP